MDIYFCDLCGARVTDADLRAGHGIRSRWDVICGACLEQGHGRDWLSQRQKPAVAAAAAASPTLDAARDRAVTLEEAEPPAPVPPKRVVADAASLPPPPPGLFDAPAEPSPVEPAPVLSEVDLTSTTKVPMPAGDQLNLAAAAGMFSALGQAPKAEEDSRGNPIPTDDEDDLADAADRPLSEDTSPSGAQARIGSGEGRSPLPPDMEPAEKRDDAEAGKEGEKDDTVSTPALPDPEALKPVAAAPEKEAKDANAKKSSTISSRHKKAGSASARTPKPSARKSARVQKPDHSKQILIVGMVMLGLIVLGFIVVFASRNIGGGKTQTGTDQRIHVDGERIKRIIDETRPVVIGALRDGEDIGKLEGALSKLNAAQDAVDQFERTMKAAGESDDAINHYLEKIAKWQDVYMLRRSVLDKIQILKQRH